MLHKCKNERYTKTTYWSHKPIDPITQTVPCRMVTFFGNLLDVSNKLPRNPIPLSVH